MIYQQVVEEGFTGGLVFFGTVIQFFTFITPALLHFVTKKYVKEIFYNPKMEEYTAITYSFFAMEKLVSLGL